MPRGFARPTYIDLFSGCGGASVGFHDAGFECLLAVDWDQQAVDAYNANFPRRHGRPVGVRADLSKIASHEDVRRFLRENGVEEGCCEVVVGGPPCQSFSSVGQTKVKALTRANEQLREAWAETARNRTGLFEVFALFVEVLAPRWILFENVPTIRSHEIYPELVRRFDRLQRPDRSRLEYEFSRENHWASDYGVPQRRRRFLMVGFQKEVGIGSWKRPRKAPGPNVADAIDDLPAVESGHRAAETAYVRQPRSAYQKLMRAGLTGTDADVVTTHICRSHNADDIELFRRMREGARFSDKEVQEAIIAVNPEHKLKKYSTDKFQDKLHKLDRTIEAWTVTAHLQKDCYKFIHYHDARTITVREAARLQSFPDRFKLPEVMGVGFRVVGNAIPPLLAQAFAESIVASDPRIGTAENRAAIFIPDAVWNQVAEYAEREFPRAKRGRAAVSIRVVLAAGVLRAYHGWTCEEAGCYFGYNANTLSTKLRRVIESGLWDVAEQAFAAGNVAGVQMALPFIEDPGEPMAAD